VRRDGPRLGWCLPGPGRPLRVASTGCYGYLVGSLSHGDSFEEMRSPHNAALASLTAVACLAAFPSKINGLQISFHAKNMALAYGTRIQQAHKILVLRFV
jgi:hypothetical protein